MATITIGDIHGNLAALRDVLQQVRDDVVDGDVVVFLGDYIDRGPDSCGCIDAILSFRDDLRVEVVCLRGNHEDWMLRTLNDFTRHSWLLGMEGLTTIRSYSVDAHDALRDALSERGLQLYVGRCSLPYDKFVEALPPSHLSFLTSLALCIETPDCVCSHAGLDPRVPQLRHQQTSALLWGNAEFPEAYVGGAPAVYGHLNNAELDDRAWPWPRVIGNTIGIDTIAHGVLTAIKMPERRIIQSGRHPLGV